MLSLKLAKRRMPARTDCGQMSKKDLKVEIPSETEMLSHGAESNAALASGQAASGLSRQPSLTYKDQLPMLSNHTCWFLLQQASSGLSLQQTKSIDPQSASFGILHLSQILPLPLPLPLNDLEIVQTYGHQ